MNKINIKNNILPLLIFTLFAPTALAANPPLSVDFNPDTLFNVSNFMPGDEESASVTVGNSGESANTAYIEAVNVSNADHLANQMNLKIFEGATQIYNGNFQTFLEAGPVILSPILSNSSKTYDLKVTFIAGAGNDYQGKTLGFDICIGFSGGSLRCTNETVVGPEGSGESSGPGSSNGGSGGSSSGSSSGGSHLLIIYNEASSVFLGGVPVSGQATITWDTNIPATSQVVYGPSGPVYTFDIDNLPAMGYPSVTPEILSKTINHTVVLTGLTPGQTYVYRVVSRASPPSVSVEHTFQVPLPQGGGNSNILSSGAGAVLGAATSDGDLGGDDSNGGAESEVLGAFDQDRGDDLAAVWSSGWGGLLSKCSLIALIILLVGYLIWKFMLEPRYKDGLLSKKEIKFRFYTYFVIFSGLAAVIAILLKEYCPVPVFVITLLISVILSVYNRGNEQ